MKSLLLAAAEAESIRDGAVATFLDYLRSNWPELVWIVIAAGAASWLAGRKARIRWRDRDFLDRLNVSLTTVRDGVLRIRTLIEAPCEDIFLNPAAAKAVVDFAKQTTAADPLLPIPEDDCWFYLNAVLNEVSERFAAGQLARDMGLPVETETYLLCLTCERAGAVRTQKVRCMVVRKSLLTDLPEEAPRFESPNHQTRWDTLRQLAGVHAASPGRFLEMEICLAK